VNQGTLPQEKRNSDGQTLRTGKRGLGKGRTRWSSFLFSCGVFDTGERVLEGREKGVRIRYYTRFSTYDRHEKLQGLGGRQEGGEGTATE